jgi:peptidoglycan LD-endopeptidase LytH|uniref:M23 family metallopeptidase n=1 Tax=Candidatus Planktophila sp. TaxID=2175601 RepID=UPI00404A2F88
MLRRISVILVSILIVGITPAVAAPAYVFPVPDCKVNYARAHHDYPATDILAKQGCKFVSPIDGVVDEVSRTDTWSGKTNLGIERGGLYVSVIGTDGVRYYGSHLRTVVRSIQPGVAVKAGRILGTIGSTGSARGTSPHLHFGISWPTPSQPNVWWVRRGAVLPWKYLEAWNQGKDLSPAKAVAKQLAKVGEIPPEPKK